MLLPNCHRDMVRLDQVPQCPHPTTPCSSRTAYPLTPRFSPINQCWLSALVAMPSLARASCHQEERQCRGDVRPHQGHHRVAPRTSGATSSSTPPMVRLPPTAQPHPLDISPLTCSFSTSSFTSSAVRPPWPCSTAIWWKNHRHFTSTSENCSCRGRTLGELHRLEPRQLGAFCDAKTLRDHAQPHRQTLTLQQRNLWARSGQA